MRTLKRIIVHCSDTHPDWMEGKPLSAKVAEIRGWHTDKPPNGRGWSDIGYHYLIDRDGMIATGRPVDREGAHVAGHNKDSIGICLLGGHGSSADDAPTENFTPDQLHALRSLIDSLREKHGDLSVTGHNRYAAKACPGFRAAKWYDEKDSLSTVSGTGGVTALAASAISDGWVQYGLIGLGLVLVVFAAWRIIEKRK